MATNKQNILIIFAAAAVAAAILLFGQQHATAAPQPAESRVYEVTGGWGYDIVVNKQVFIRQQTVPVIQQLQPFKTKEEAERVANLVLTKMKSGQLPTLSETDLRQLLPEYEAGKNNAQDR